MKLLTHTPLRHALSAGAIVISSFGAAMLFSPGAASASDTELQVNELAPEITASADAAVDALEAFEASGDPADERLLAFHRAATARYTARQLGYDELAMIDAWATTTLEHQRAVLGALTQVGVPYRTNTSVEGEGFDCSGLTSYAWRGAGHELYRNSGAQISDAKRLERDDAKAGDLVHYPGHVMLYLGVDDAVVHSVQTGRTVEVDTISERRSNSVSWGDPTLGD